MLILERWILEFYKENLEVRFQRCNYSWMYSKSLEGDNKTAVEEKLFVKELEKSGKFTEEEARNYIRRMLREASIYESKPGHYNRV